MRINFIRSLFLQSITQFFCSPSNAYVELEVVVGVNWHYWSISQLSLCKVFSQTITSKMTSMTMKWPSMMKKKKESSMLEFFPTLNKEQDSTTSRRHSIIWHSTIEHNSVVASDNFKDFAMAVLSCHQQWPRASQGMTMMSRQNVWLRVEQG